MLHLILNFTRARATEVDEYKSLHHLLRSTCNSPTLTSSYYFQEKGSRRKVSVAPRGHLAAKGGHDQMDIGLLGRCGSATGCTAWCWPVWSAGYGGACLFVVAVSALVPVCFAGSWRLLRLLSIGLGGHVHCNLDTAQQLLSILHPLYTYILLRPEV